MQGYIFYLSSVLVYMLTVGLYLLLINAFFIKKFLHSYTFLSLATLAGAVYVYFEIHILYNQGSSIMWDSRWKAFIIALMALLYFTTLHLILFDDKKWIKIAWLTLPPLFPLIFTRLVYTEPLREITIRFFSEEIPYYLPTIRPLYTILYSLVFLFVVILLIKVIMKRKYIKKIMLIVFAITPYLAGALDFYIYLTGKVHFFFSFISFFLGITFVFLYMLNTNRVMYLKVLTVNQRLEKLVAKKTEELQKQYQERNALFTTLAHETKMPLGMISKYLQQYISKAGQNQKLDIIQYNLEKLKRDMVNFLDLEEMKKGHTLYDHAQVFSLSDLIKEKTVILETTFRHENLHLQTRIEEDLCVRADPAAIDRVVNNLLSNAVKYTPEGGHIQLELTHSQGHVNLQVKDDGIGIDPENLDKIFLPYYQLTHSKKNWQGLGMGLSLTKNILIEINGAISVASDPGAGSTFTITLPLAEISEAEFAGRYKTKNPDFSTSDIRLPETISISGQPNILLVEDDKYLLNYLIKCFTPEYNVFWALNGQNALELLSRIPVPDVIISDIMMDGLSGIDFFRKVMDVHDFQNVPFLFLTARDEQDEKIQLLSQGAVDYINKPFGKKELLARVSNMLRIVKESRSVMVKQISQLLKTQYEQEISIEDNDQSFTSKCEQFHLTKREIDVLELLFEGLLDKEISHELNISFFTVRSHISHIYNKCSVQNRMELLRLFENAV